VLASEVYGAVGVAIVRTTLETRTLEMYPVTKYPDVAQLAPRVPIAKVVFCADVPVDAVPIEVPLTYKVNVEPLKVTAR
jgi:hypothetical protein